MAEVCVDPPVGDIVISLIHAGTHVPGLLHSYLARAHPAGSSRTASGALLV
jgi:hypothetical protein